MSLLPVVTRIGDILGYEKNEMISLFTEWNKNKVYPVSLIDIKIGADGVTDNSEMIGELVENIGAFVDDVVKNTLDAESVTDAKKTVAEIGKFLAETRKIQTNPLKEVAGKFTKHEAKFKDYNDALTEKLEKINELEYQNRARAIREYFESLIKEQELTEIVGMDAFNDFVDNKRKTNIFTTTGGLTKGIRDAVAEALRVVVEPIRAQRELEAKKSLQSKQFESYLDGIETEGDNALLEANIKSLMRLKESIESLYPDISESCFRSVDNKISRCESNIRANTAIAEKDAIKNADGKYMDIAYAEIKIASQDMTLGVEDLKVLADQLREFYPKLTFAENKEKVKMLGASIAQRIVALELSELEDDGETPPREVVIPVNTYIVSIHDIEVLANMEIDAENEDDAKKELVRRFESHLSMIDLIKKG